MASKRPPNIEIADLSKLDYSFLQTHDQYTLANWSNLVLKDLADILTNRVFSYTDNDPVSVNFSDVAARGHNLMLHGDIERVVFRQNNPNGFFRPLCPMIAYVAMTHPKVTCHELVFGEKKRIILDRRTECLLKGASKLPRKTFDDLIALMDENYLEINNATYTLHRRLTDIAALDGSTAFSFFISCKTYAHRPYQIEKVLLGVPALCEDIADNRRFWLHYSAMALALYASIYLNLSMDYLLIQDYSNLASYSDGELTPDEKRFLASFLYADPSVYPKVYAAIIKNQI